MGQTNVYGERRLVYVTPITGSLVRYGFKTSIDETESGTLGQTLFEIGTMVNGITFGARYPRPRKYKKQTATYSVTSFADIGTTAPNGYKKSGEAKIFPYTSRNSGRSRLVFTNAASGESNLKYAWYMPEYQYTQVSGALDGLGITTSVSSSNQKDVIFQVGRKGGTRGFPVPARYSKTFDGDGESGNTVTTYGNATALPSGWALIEGALTSL